MTNGDTPAPPMGEARVCNSPVVLSAEPKPKNRTSINIFANFAFDLIPKFACDRAGRIVAKRRIDTLVPRTRSSHKFAERSDANFGFRSGTTRIGVASVLIDSEVRTSAPQMLTNFGIGTLENAELIAAINCNCGFVRRRLWRPVRACAFRGAEVARNLGFGSPR